MFVFKLRTAYGRRISDWSSDVCSSDLGGPLRFGKGCEVRDQRHATFPCIGRGHEIRRSRRTRYPSARDARAVAVDEVAALPGTTEQRDCSRKTAQRGQQYRSVAEIGTASCWERVCQYVEFRGGAASS